ncbi:uncharacterized protein M6B38_260245 [Iris pallida]|uniref:Remorin C-terminal domain-containing protein n=1 Tax=Iris pallida TaxID=29817 RepID=A0AAX6IGA2_IRIPA|nr:uncharacterized protein M6B38_260245 [Iris pallida]
MSGDDQRPSSTTTTTTSSRRDIEHPEVVRDIHALTLPQPASHGRREESWEAGSRSSTLSLGSEVANFGSMSREFNALVVAGSTAHGGTAAAENLGRIREEESGREEEGREALEETNPLAIVPDSNPAASPRFSNNTRASTSTATSGSILGGGSAGEVSVHRVKMEEVAWKIGAWETAEVAKINNRFKTEEVEINVWESEQEEKAAARLRKIEAKKTRREEGEGDREDAERHSESTPQGRGEEGRGEREEGDEDGEDLGAVAFVQGCREGSLLQEVHLLVILTRINCALGQLFASL